jgi:adenylyltransferase/sulfurtransferase
MLKQTGIEGQEKIGQAKILVCGAGGLGSPVIAYLAAAGIGSIGICDFDTVNLSNLNRQFLYGYKDIGSKKAATAKDFIKNLNPETKITVFEEKLTAGNIDSVMKGYEIAIDAADNFDTRFLINAAAYRNGIPLISGAVCEFEGILTAVVPKESTACFQCVYPFKPADEKTFGIFGAVCGVIGSLQALETLKLILNLETLKNKLLIYDGLQNSFRIKELAKRKNCAVCG